MTTLVVAAHPDDEVLGCGATAARLAAHGEDVVLAILGEGAVSRYSNPADADQQEVAALAADSRRAADVLGAKEVRLFGLPDNRFDTVALLDIVKLIEDVIADVSPQCIYTHHGGDLNIDHQMVFKATLAATRPVPGQGVTELYAFEVNSSTEWAFQRVHPVFRPSVFVDVSETLDVKVEALEAYSSEIRAFPHPRSPEAVRAAAQRWGSVVGVAAAEAFEPIRVIRR